MRAAAPTLPGAQAYLAAGRALQLEPSNSKARYRVARTLLQLRCYMPALEHAKAVRQQVGGLARKQQLSYEWQGGA